MSVSKSIPTGPKNLIKIFPSVPFEELEEYYLELYSPENLILGTTNKFKVQHVCEDNVRVHFLNRLGTVDAINFKRVLKEHEIKSSKYVKPQAYPVQKHTHSSSRMDVTSSGLISVINDTYSEEDMDFLLEFMESPLAWLEWNGIQGQPDDYLPVVIIDKKIQPLKEDDRFRYEISCDLQLSHTNQSIRN